MYTVRVVCVCVWAKGKKKFKPTAFPYSWHPNVKTWLTFWKLRKCSSDMVESVMGFYVWHTDWDSKRERDTERKMRAKKHEVYCSSYSASEIYRQRLQFYDDINKLNPFPAIFRYTWWCTLHTVHTLIHLIKVTLSDQSVRWL